MIRNGSKVKIHYTLKVDDKVVDSSLGSEPLVYVQGQGQLVPGLEEQLEGVGPGEKKQITVPPDQGYGKRKDEALHNVPKTAFREPDTLTIGDVVSGEVRGEPFQARVANVGNEEITLDLNHPLAGKTLDFEVEVLEVA